MCRFDTGRHLIGESVGEARSIGLPQWEIGWVVWSWMSHQKPLARSASCRRGNSPRQK